MNVGLRGVLQISSRGGGGGGEFIMSERLKVVSMWYHLVIH